MSSLWPYAGASDKLVLALPRQGASVPSTQEVLARALAKSTKRGSRVARWRTARRWVMYHLWRYVFPLVLILLAPSSQLDLPSSQTIAAPKPATPPIESLASPKSGVEVVPPMAPPLTLALIWQLRTPTDPAVAIGSPASFAVPDEPINLKADSSLHSQEP